MDFFPSGVSTRTKIYIKERPTKNVSPTTHCNGPPEITPPVPASRSKTPPKQNRPRVSSEPRLKSSEEIGQVREPKLRVTSTSVEHAWFFQIKKVGGLLFDIYLEEKKKGEYLRKAQNPFKLPSKG